MGNTTHNFTNRIFSSISAYSEDNDKISSDVRSWDVEDYNAVFKIIGLDRRIDDVNQYYSEANNIENNGKRLSDIKLKDAILWNAIWEYLNDKLMNNGKFDFLFVKVVKKMINNHVYHARDSNKNLSGSKKTGIGLTRKDVQNLCRIAEWQSDARLIKKYYLDLDERTDFYNYYLKYSYNHQKLKKVEMRVKLIITDKYDNKPNANGYDIRKLGRKIISPLIGRFSKFNFSTKMFHTAVLIGPYYIEYNDSGLVNLKINIESGNAIPGIDMQSIDMMLDKTGSKDYTQIKKKIAKVIEIWNTKWRYYLFPNVNDRIGNCQVFVEHLFKELHLSLNFKNGCVKDFINDMSKKGSAKFSFTTSIQFRSELTLNYYYLWGESMPMLIAKNKFHFEYFETHEMLDNFCHELKDLLHDKKYEKEYHMFKAFDRALWLKFFKAEAANVIEEMNKYRSANATTDQSYGIAFPTGCLFLNPKDCPMMMSNPQSKNALQLLIKDEQKRQEIEKKNNY